MNPRLRQSGAVLITALVLLLIMTLLGLASMQNTSLEERMAGNMRHANIAFQAAESALRQGEAWIASRTAEPTPTSDGSSGIWSLDGPESLPSSFDSAYPWWQQLIDTDWAKSGVSTYDHTLKTAGSVNLDSAMPRYVIEERRFVSDSLELGQGSETGRMFYQVTARGTDVSGRMQVMLQSSFARRY